MIRSIAQHIENNSTLVIGTTLFVGHRPDTAAANCVSLFERVPGRANPMVPSEIQKPIQLLTRNASYTAGWTIAQAGYSIFFGRDQAGFALPVMTSGDSEYYVNIATGSEPAFIGRDVHGNFEFSCNLMLRISEQ